MQLTMRSWNKPTPH